MDTTNNIDSNAIHEVTGVDELQTPSVERELSHRLARQLREEIDRRSSQFDRSEDHADDREKRRGRFHVLSIDPTDPNYEELLEEVSRFTTSAYFNAFCRKKGVTPDSPEMQQLYEEFDSVFNAPDPEVLSGEVRLRTYVAFLDGVPIATVTARVGLGESPLEGLQLIDIEKELLQIDPRVPVAEVTRLSLNYDHEHFREFDRNEVMEDAVRKGMIWQLMLKEFTADLRNNSVRQLFAVMKPNLMKQIMALGFRGRVLGGMVHKDGESELADVLKTLAWRYFKRKPYPVLIDFTESLLETELATVEEVFGTQS